jgi:hypothetical protein
MGRFSTYGRGGGQGLSKFSDPQVNCPERTQNWGCPLEAGPFYDAFTANRENWNLIHRRAVLAFVFR